MKKIVRLTESDLHRIVKESVNKILCEVMSPEQKEKRKQWRLKMKNLEKSALIKSIYSNLSNAEDYEIHVDCDTITYCWKGDDGRVWIEISGDYRPLDDFPTKFLDEIHRKSIWVAKG